MTFSNREISEDTAKWLDAFAVTHKRPMRVLHIGNIANNAYINAKIMRRIGIDADVICHDYYHIMGCPEWEDADFEGDPGDPFFPNWGRVDLKGFARPKWFYQGPRKYVMKKIIAINNEQYFQAGLYNIIIDFGVMLTASKYNPITLLKYLLGRRGVGKFALAPVYVMGAFLYFIVKLFLKIRQACSYVFSIVHQFLGKIFVATRNIRKNGNKFQRVALYPVSFLYNARNRYRERKYRNLDFEKVVEKSSRFNLDEEDTALLLRYASVASDFKVLFDRYDFIVAYSTDGIYPMVAGNTNFASYEHGTIRDIPFENTDRGRLCALTYQHSPAVFITNTDCVPAADRLGIERARQYWMPHALDTHKIFGIYDEMRPQVEVANDPAVFFSPARQHWQVDDSGLGKGNDKIIHAAKILSDQGADFKVEFVEWGQDVDATKKLISDLGVDRHFGWRPAFRKRELLIEYLRAAAVIDQFVFPAMGGITFEALAMGRPVISYLDAQQLGTFFGEAPPIHNCSTAEDIAKAMHSVIYDAKANIKLGQDAQNWVRKYHSSERVLDIQLRAISTILDAENAEAA
jgi:glycosyltransferase involved in cell wall biosynthesis